MKIKEATIEISAVSQKQYPTANLPEIALAGRSNVGKSSFINRMLGRRNLVRTSSKPGKTRTLNFYRINDAFYFVDVPGYGYAKVSKTEQQKWGAMMEEYFETREPLQLVVLVIDSRHDPTQDDMRMIEYISYLNIPLLIIATKVDKLKKNARQNQLRHITSIIHDVAADVQVIPFSAETGENKDRIWDILAPYI
ncbi:MAG TPA: ribosome biogenesis GTP-binding protein YihA/YsxC [Pseudogracilibacillus sp.]|nr:ribosome biogenesis GTP-binding protein YihA/YsxC [Pseudogracilibacillus sp.]